MTTKVLGQITHFLRETSLKTRLPITSNVFLEITPQLNRSCTQFPLWCTTNLETFRPVSQHRNALSNLLCVSVCDTELNWSLRQNFFGLPPLYSKVRGCSWQQNSLPVDESAAQLRLHTSWHGRCSSHCLSNGCSSFTHILFFYYKINKSLTVSCNTPIQVSVSRTSLLVSIGAFSSSTCLIELHDLESMCSVFYSPTVSLCLCMPQLYTQGKVY